MGGGCLPGPKWLEWALELKKNNNNNLKNNVFIHLGKSHSNKISQGMLGGGRLVKEVSLADVHL